MKSVCVVGTGYWGINLVRNYNTLGALRCIADTSAERAAAIASQFDCPARSWAEVLNDPEIHAVAIATPAHTHYPLIKEAILHGKDVFVEKPLTLQVSECQEVTRMAEEHGRILMVDHLLKYHPAVLRLKQLIDDGELGEIQYIYSNRLNLGKIRREENALWSFAPHDISVILMLLGDRLPLQVTASGGCYLQPAIADTTVSSMTFDRGIQAHIFVSWLHPYKEQRLVVIGSNGMAAFDDTLPTDKLRLYDKNIDLVEGQFVVQKPVSRIVDYSQSEPLQAVCRHFLECMETRQTPFSDGHDGYRVLAVLAACQESLDLKGAPVRLDSEVLEFSASR